MLLLFISDEDVMKDEDLESFWNLVECKGQNETPKNLYGLPKFGKEGLVEYLTHFAFRYDQ